MKSGRTGKNNDRSGHAGNNGINAWIDFRSRVIAKGENVSMMILSIYPANGDLNSCNLLLYTESRAPNTV